MKVASKKLPRGQAELTVELTTDEYRPFLERAAVSLSEKISIPGFRPGKVPVTVAAEKFGEAKVWEEALEPAVRKTILPALAEAKVTSIGSPQIGIITLAPGNPVSYRAIVSVLPEVELADFSSVKVARKTLTVTDADVARTIEDLRKLRRTETLVTRPAQPTDKVELKLQTLFENVPIDQGPTDRLPLVLGEGRFLPGFEEHIVGMSTDQEKTFRLQMPDTYHNRTVAGKEVEFKVKMLAVYELTVPEVTDAFAKQLGRFASLQDLRSKLKNSLLSEAVQREDERLEGEILEALIARSKFSDIPDLLVNTETKNMVAELEQTVKQQGGNFEDYLAHLKKTRADLLLDFTPAAVQRVKGALLTRAVARKHRVEVSNSEVDAAIQKEFSTAADDVEHKERMRRPEFRAYVRNILASRKVMALLKKTITGVAP